MKPERYWKPRYQRHTVCYLRNNIYRRGDVSFIVANNGHRLLKSPILLHATPDGEARPTRTDRPRDIVA